MSWNKNTIVNSALDATIKVLEDVNVPYTLSVRGWVSGNGLNDDIDWGESKVYELRRLQYGQHIILEQMERACDCDADDYLNDKEFASYEEPGNYPLEIFICVCGNDCYNLNEKENENALGS